MMNFADGTSRAPTSSVRLPITPNPSGTTNLAPPPGETPYATKEFVYELFSKIKDSSIFPATDKTLGGVIVGSGLSVDAAGRIDVVFPSHADYLTKTDAASTYAKLSALTDYLTKTDAGNTYAKLSALADYLTKTDAGNTYATKTELGRHIPFIVDRSGTYTAALVGTFAKDHDTAKTGKRALSVGYLNSVTGDDSIAVGKNNRLPGTSSACFGEGNYAETQAFVIGAGSTAGKTCMALGYNVTAGVGSYSCAMALGRNAVAERSGSFVWNGQALDTPYSGGSRLGATFSVNPVGGIEGFYIGDKVLSSFLDVKRDKTDNTAAADSSVILPGWTFHCDVPELQSLLDETNPEVWYEPNTDGNPPYWVLTCPGETENYRPDSDYSDSDASSIDATEVVWSSAYMHKSTGKWVKIAGTREVVPVAKTGESFVTPTGVKALTAPGFSQIVPETSEGKVTLKPMDGKANWVDGIVRMKGGKEKNLNCTLYSSIEYYPTSGELPSDMPMALFLTARVVLSSDNAVVEKVEDDGLCYISIKTLKPVEIRYDEDQFITDPTSYGFPSNIASGVMIYCEAEELTSDCDNNIEDCSFTASSIQFIWGGFGEGYPDRFTYRGEEFELYGAFNGSSNFTQTITEGYKDPHIVLPSNTDKACIFSVAFTTDAENEMDVAWEGGDIIEAFPGAKNLVPSTGEIVFDVKEIAPGKMLVNRVPGASGGSVTLTSENGSSYELIVNNSGELEVKES